MDCDCVRVRTAENPPRDWFYLFKRRHGLAEIVEGCFVLVERRRVKFPCPERGFIDFSENASRHGHRFAQQCLSFCEAL